METHEAVAANQRTVVAATLKSQILSALWILKKSKNQSSKTGSKVNNDLMRQIKAKKYKLKYKRYRVVL